MGGTRNTGVNTGVIIQRYTGVNIQRYTGVSEQKSMTRKKEEGVKGCSWRTRRKQKTCE